jgi:hypothetical protein
VSIDGQHQAEQEHYQQKTDSSSANGCSGRRNATAGFAISISIASADVAIPVTIPVAVPFTIIILRCTGLASTSHAWLGILVVLFFVLVFVLVFFDDGDPIGTMSCCTSDLSRHHQPRMVGVSTR